MQSESVYPVRLYYTKLFTGGLLKGIAVIESMPFCDYDTAAEYERWGRKGVKRPMYHGSPWRIIDSSFQNYSRG